MRVAIRLVEDEDGGLSVVTERTTAIASVVSSTFMARITSGMGEGCFPVANCSSGDVLA